MLIETHAHLDYSDVVPGSPKVLERAADTGARCMITIGTSTERVARVVS